MDEIKNFSRNSKLIIIVLFTIAGVMIGAVTYVSFISQNARMILKACMVGISLAAWLVFNKNERLQRYKQFAASFFSVSLGVLLAQYLGNIPLKLLSLSVTTVQGVAIAKFGEALPVVLSILIVHFATGGDRDGLFMGKGNLKLALIAGLIGFGAFAFIGFLQTVGLGLTWSAVGKASPWILIFIFSNAFLEELWFRALFLKKIEPLVGAKTSLIITSLIFASVHISSTYVIDILLFMVLVMALGLLWGWLMQKSNSIWGSVLIHAGGDILAILGFLASAQ